MNYNDLLGPVAELLKEILSPLKTQVCYLKNHKRSFSSLIKEKQRLEESEMEVKEWVDDHRYMGRAVKHRVIDWLHRTAELKNEVGSIIGQYRDENRSLYGLLPNYRHIYCLGKAAELKLEELEEHKKEAPTGRNAVASSPRIVKRLKMRSVPLDGQQVAPATLRKILNCLRNEAFARIGIYGMGGVGKTTLMEHVNNEVEDFDYLFFIKVTKDPNYKTIRNAIAQILYLSLPDEDEVRAQQLIFNRLQQPDTRYLLILDDVWPDFAFQELGIPDPAPSNRCKIVVVSRFLDVCNAMLTDRNVKVDLMSEGDARNLFRKMAGEVVEDPVVEETAKKVLNECCRLPLAIIAVGKSMRNQRKPELWYNALRALRNSTGDDIDIRGIDSQVYRSLRHSYDCLDAAAKTTFLYFSLFPEDEIIFTYFLSVNWYLEGFMQNVSNFKDVDERGSTIITRLEEAGLLQRGDYSRNVMMHDLVRDMAIRIARSTDELMCFTKTGATVEVAPEEEEWKKAKRMSLMGTRIDKLPEKPDCPQLFTLLLEGNECLSVIPNGFFDRMQALQVLNLNGTKIKSLPPSLSSLKKLRALYFYSCKQLFDISAVKDLPELQVLDLYLTSVEELPDGFENLLNLRILRIGFTEKLNKIPPNLFLRMTRLEVLNMYRSYGYWAVLGADQAHKFSGSREWMNLKDLVNMNSLSSLDITINETVESLEWLLNSTLADRLEGLAIRSCHHFRGIDSACTQKARKLRALTLQSCPDVETIINCDDPEMIIFPNLRLLQLEELPRLQNIYMITNGHIDFRRLEKLTIKGCMQLTNLFSPDLLKQLDCLNHFDVSECPHMERIIEGEVGEEDSILPKMTSFRISDMGALSLIYDGVVELQSLRSVEVSNCPLLRKLPFDLQHSRNIRSIKGEHRWIDALEWHDQATRCAFARYFSFKLSEF